MNLNILALALENKLSREVFNNNFLLNKESCLDYIRTNFSKEDNICVINNAMLLVTLLMNNHSLKKITFIYDHIQKKRLSEMLGFDSKQLLDRLQVSESDLKALSLERKILSCMFYNGKEKVLLDSENLFNLHPINSLNYYQDQNNFAKIKSYTVIDTKNKKVIDNVKAGSILKEVVNILETDKRDIFLDNVINDSKFKINNFHMCLDKQLKSKLIQEGFTRTQTWGHKFSFKDKEIYFCTQFGYKNAGELCLLIRKYLFNLLKIEYIFIEPKKN